MNAVFLDTGYVLALELANDQNHARATAHWNQLRSSLPRLLTTSYVFDEVVTFFNSRGYHAKGVEVGNNLLLSPSLDFIHVDEPLFHEAWSYFQRNADKEYSLTDCVSFVLMQRRGIQAALAFDKHFVQAGFQKLP